MTKVLIDNVTKIYPNGNKAVDNVSIDIDAGEFVVLVGPSGCGKSTLLRMIAGLEDISSGNIFFDDQIVNDTLAKHRDIGMVFQNYALYPHLNVFDNIAFPLKIKNESKDNIKHRVEEIAELVGLSDLLRRKPKELSGGQRQRVALGRAIAKQPKVFLFDEPLSNLDAKLRVQMRTEIINLQKKLGTTSIYVTHDQVEAMTMGSKIVLMNQGVVQQIDSPDGIYSNPSNIFTAGFIGSPQMNFFEGKISREKGFRFIENNSNIEFEIENSEFNNYLAKEIKKIKFGVRPEMIKVSDSIIPNMSYFKSKIINIEYLGHETLIYFKTNTVLLCARVTGRQEFALDKDTYFCFDSSNLLAFDAKGDRIYNWEKE